MAFRVSNRALALASVLSLNGCWTAPVVTTRPDGEPRVIQQSVAIRFVREEAVVQTVDAQARTLVIGLASAPAGTAYRVAPSVSGLELLHPGDRVRATVEEKLTVFMPPQDHADTGERADIAADARVLAVEPSYRLLTLQYSDGRRETFKVGLDVRLLQMELGDNVMIRERDLLALQVRGR